MTGVAGIPGVFEWHGDEPRSWSAGEVVAIDAGPRTDLFVSPAGDAPILGAPRLVTRVYGDFVLAALVEPALRATFDAGVLVVWVEDATWAKLCLERSPEGEPTVVSVVTRGVSDDCNSFAVDGGAAWLRVARLGRAWAFHASLDGRAWRLIRHFSLGSAGDPLVGFLAQSPTGDGCAVSFREVTFRPETLADLRSGV